MQISICWPGSVTAKRGKPPKSGTSELSQGESDNHVLIEEYYHSYFMFSQHRHEAYLVAAKFDQEYLDYLLDERNINLNSLAFYCFGPFDIYNSEHIFTLGRIITTLTIESN